jgi:uncharacterized coiled-coil protein SlyX
MYGSVQNVDTRIVFLLMTFMNQKKTSENLINNIGGKQMTREELKEQIDELMQQYANEEIDGDTYAQKMLELTTSAQNDNN